MLSCYTKIIINSDCMPPTTNDYVTINDQRNILEILISNFQTECHIDPKKITRLEAKQLSTNQRILLGEIRAKQSELEYLVRSLQKND